MSQYETYNVEGSSLSGPSKQVGDKVERVIVFLHGYGADGNDLISLSEPLGQGIENCLFVSPHAPFACDMSPMGRQWFSIDLSEPREFGKGAESARPELDGFLTGLMKQTGVAAENVVLVGFSQGTMMALTTAYQREEAFGAVIGFSGALPDPENFLPKVKSKPPVLLVHGQADPVVPHSLMLPAASMLSAAEIEVQTHSVPGLQHGIDNSGLNAAYMMLRRVYG